MVFVISSLVEVVAYMDLPTNLLHSVREGNVFWSLVLVPQWVRRVPTVRGALLVQVSLA